MDVYRILEELVSERRKIDKLIQVLETLQNGDGKARPQAALASRRGRKSMDAEERKEVSERMLRYWAERRQKQGEEST